MATPTFMQSIPIFGSQFTRPLSPRPCGLRPVSLAHTRRRVAVFSCTIEPKIEDELEDNLKPDKETEKKWADIEWPSIDDELRAIEKYVEEEDVSPDGVWPNFLRAGAYDSRGQSQKALEILKKIRIIGNIARVPIFWERMAYNAFRLGEVAEANKFIEEALFVWYEAMGNELHFTHWFHENFEYYMPKHNGPAYTFQRGIVKYVIGNIEKARFYIVSGLIVEDIGFEHGLLWFLASSARLSTGLPVSKPDLAVVNRWMKEHAPAASTAMRYCIDLYTQSANAIFTNVEELLQKLTDIAEGIHSEESLTAAIYLALYYDSISIDDEKRDLWLDKIAALPDDPTDTSSLNFVYCAAKYRFHVTIPDEY